MVLATTGIIATTAACYVTVNRFIESFVPLQWQYRPGSVSAYLAKLLAKHAKRRRRARPIRVYMDGCFDMMHYGHANALRQAKQCGDVLVVGCIPDKEIIPVKGPPVNNEEERFTMVSAVKWVDEVLTDVPYDLTEDFLMTLFTKHQIDYVVHGDDPCLLPDGTDAYSVAKRLGRFKMIKRTEGVSSTDIVGRMLLCSRTSTQEITDLHHHFAEGEMVDSEDDSDPGDPTGVRSPRGGSPRRKRIADRIGSDRSMPEERTGEFGSPSAEGGGDAAAADSDTHRPVLTHHGTLCYSGVVISWLY